MRGGTYTSASACYCCQQLPCTGSQTKADHVASTYRFGWVYVFSAGTEEDWWRSPLVSWQNLGEVPSTWWSLVFLLSCSSLCETTATVIASLSSPMMLMVVSTAEWSEDPIVPNGWQRSTSSGRSIRMGSREEPETWVGKVTWLLRVYIFSRSLNCLATRCWFMSCHHWHGGNGSGHSPATIGHTQQDCITMSCPQSEEHHLGMMVNLNIMAPWCHAYRLEQQSLNTLLTDLIVKLGFNFFFLFIFIITYNFRISCLFCNQYLHWNLLN